MTTLDSVETDSLNDSVTSSLNDSLNGSMTSEEVFDAIDFEGFTDVVRYIPSKFFNVGNHSHSSKLTGTFSVPYPDMELGMELGGSRTHC